MIRIIIFAAVICAAIVLGPYLAGAQGFVHIAAGDYIIETSVTTAVIVILLLIFAVWLVFFLIKHVIAVPHGTLRWFHRRSARKALTLQDEAFIAYEEGDYQKTVDLLLKSGPMEDLPVRALFVGAKSAFNVEDYEITHKFLDCAESLDRKSAQASRIVRAKLNLRMNNAKAALEDLQGVSRRLKNRLICRLYYLAYKRERDLPKLAAITKDLEKFHLITAQDAERISEELFETRIRDAQTAEDLKTLWKGFPREVRHDPRFAGAYTCRLLDAGDTAHACSIALDFLKRGLAPEMLEAVSQWDKAAPEVLKFLNAKAADDEISSGVNLPLLKARGNLEYRAGRLQEALDLYRKALELAPEQGIYMRIAEILKDQQNFAEAADTFARAAKLQESSARLPLKY